MRQGARPGWWYVGVVLGVTGATGELGGRLARRLVERGEAVRLLVRDPGRAPTLSQAEVRSFGGYDDAAGLRGALTGVSTLFMVSAREAANRVEQHTRAVDAAAAAGVGRIIYLSFVGAAADATFTFAREHFRTEQHIRGAGMAFTFSRQNLYTDLLPVIGGPEGVIRGPADDGRVAPVCRDDVADALVAMMTGPGHDGMTYTLTGPQAFTLAELAELVTELSGQTLTYEDETLEQARASRAGYGAPAWEIDGWISTYTAIAAGEFDIVTDDVARLTGREPTSVQGFLAAR